MTPCGPMDGSITCLLSCCFAKNKDDRSNGENGPLWLSSGKKHDDDDDDEEDDEDEEEEEEEEEKEEEEEGNERSHK